MADTDKHVEVEDDVEEEEEEEEEKQGETLYQRHRRATWALRLRGCHAPVF